MALFDVNIIDVNYFIILQNIKNEIATSLIKLEKLSQILHF